MTKLVLFVCSMNSVRSPMAAALLRRCAGDEIRVDSAGVYEGGLDPFVELVMKEAGVVMDAHEPKSLDDVDLSDVDVLIALTPEAVMKARRNMPGMAVEFWETENPSEARGDQEAVIGAYRRVRDELAARIRARFPEHHEKP